MWGECGEGQKPSKGDKSYLERDKSSFGGPKRHWVRHKPPRRDPKATREILKPRKGNKRHYRET